MKRIVNGLTYNTDTSIVVARCEWEDEDGSRVSILYKTRGGAFFLDHEVTKTVWNHKEQQKEVRVVHEFEPISHVDAQQWLLTGEVEVINNDALEEPAEATAKAETEATMLTRMPAILKRQIEKAAEEDQLSANAWMMRCAEGCLGRRKSDRKR